MKYHTVVNEVKALQRASAVHALVCARVCVVPVRALALLEQGFVCQEVAVIMPPSRSGVFQGIMRLHGRRGGGREVRLLKEYRELRSGKSTSSLSGQRQMLVAKPTSCVSQNSLLFA